MIWLGVAVVGATVHSRRLPAGRARLEIWQRWWALGALGLGSLWMFLSFAGMFLWGAVIGHVYQSFANGDHAAGNTGGVLIYDLLIPALMIVLAKRSLRSDTEQPGLDVPSVGSGDAVDPELIAAIPEWAELPAVRAGQVLPWNPEPPLTFQAAAASADALTKAIDHH
ncbi:DUF6790 family protein [Kribbella sp. NPDC006257]|uniref:DUF6790 family protein n=1 Tax=Kribbella sp. NPDC006257 TaxID=3156738 RepID=UPI0033A24CD2